MVSVTQQNTDESRRAQTWQLFGCSGSAWLRGEELDLDGTWRGMELGQILEQCLFCKISAQNRVFSLVLFLMIYFPSLLFSMGVYLTLALPSNSLSIGIHAHFLAKQNLVGKLGTEKPKR